MKEPSLFTLRNSRNVAAWYARLHRTGGRDLIDLRNGEQLRRWNDLQSKKWKRS